MVSCSRRRNKFFIAPPPPFFENGSEPNSSRPIWEIAVARNSFLIPSGQRSGEFGNEIRLVIGRITPRKLLGFLE